MDIKKDAFIWDIDGVICDSTIALKHIVGVKQPDWRSYNDSLKYCKINKWAKKLLQILQFNQGNIDSSNIILLTARSEENRKSTEMWLLDNNIFYNHLLMRELGDKSSSYIVKEKILKEKILPKYNVILAIDDDLDNVRMFEENNISCVPINCLFQYKD